MSGKTQLNRQYWNDSKQIFFTPKLSLEGRNLFPQISELHAFHVIRDQPFLNILKKPIMSLFDRAQMRSEKKPVCIVGTPKEVEVRHIRTSTTKKNRQEHSQSDSKKQTIYPCTPYLLKTETEVFPSPSKQLIPITHPPPEGSHFYILGPGNNRNIVQEVLKVRQGWLPTNSSIFHFRWEQARPKFQNQSAPHRQLLNHLPGHQIISDKGNLLSCLKLFCEKQEEPMYQIVPASFILDFGAEGVEEELKRFVTFFVDCASRNDPDPQKEEEDSKTLRSTYRKRLGNPGELIVMLDSPKKGNFKQSNKISPLKFGKNRINQISQPENKKKEEIKNMYKSLITSLKPYYIFQDMSTPKKENPWITAEINDVYGESSLWLLKPSDLNRGRRIKLFRSVEELGELLKGDLQKNQKGSFIVQKYIERPLLLNQRKFDIRMWALITQTKELYFFQEGYIRLSSQPFTLDSCSLFTHLTNNAVQKHASNYGEFQQGNILPLSYLYEQAFIYKAFLYKQIKRLILLSTKAAGGKLYQPTEKNCSISVGSTGLKHLNSKMKHFQVFGYDFMVDSNNHLWLIEVNTNPCLELSNKWLSCIIPRMLDDAFRLTIDKVFPPKNRGREEKNRYSVQGYSDEANMWEILSEDESEKIPTVE